jgi:hypothetical protein
MKQIIEDLKDVKCHIDTLIWHLEGKAGKATMRDGGTVKGELSCYDDEGKDLQDIIEKLLKEHGDETLPTCD